MNTAMAIQGPSRRGAARVRLALPVLFALILSLVMIAPVRATRFVWTKAKNESEAAELYQALLDLRSPWTVMCVAAHPDDEDGATLTVLRRKYGVHTVSLFSTYGEGGQNAIGPELYEDLGAIRERETRAAAAIQGSVPYFLGLRDFGFSKSADEAFRVWGHDEALRRMVQKIREQRPDVIITNHDTTGGHGHHQATGRLVLEAFDAAADSSRFPEQLREGLETWQAQRLFVRMNYEGGAATKALDEEAERAGAVAQLDINERDPVRGSTYAEQALEALRRHASQGPWPQTLPPGGRPPIRYRLAREAKQAPPLPSHPQTFLDGLTLPAAMAARLAPPTIDARPLTDFLDQRERVLDALIVARKRGLFVADKSDKALARFRLMNERLDRALALAAGVDVTLTPREAVVSPDRPIYFNLHIANTGARTVIYHDAVSGCWQDHHSLDSHKLGVPSELKPGMAFDVQEATYVPPRAIVNVPRAEHLYDGRLSGERCTSNAALEIEGAKFMVNSAAQIDVAPAVEIKSISPSPVVLTPATIGRPPTINVRLVNHQPKPFEGRFESEDALKTFKGFMPPLALAANETRELRYEIDAASAKAFQPRRSGAANNSLSFTIKNGDATRIITRREVSIVYSDARVAPNLRVGYLPSYDETLKNALAALGVKAIELTIDEVRAGKLEGYDTIIIDNRGYQAHPELVAANARLLDYTRAGGTLVVFYHKNFEWNPDQQKGRPQLAPYPLILGSARVTDENAPVTFNEAGHALLNSPNKIGPDDFKDWIQERGLYYPKDWDPRYSAPLSTGDTGEQPLNGGLLATDYGRGRYIYTSMVWYRQLRAGVPGAYRLFANMISYGHAGEGAHNK